MTLSDPLSLTFAALADPTRRAILARLTEGEASVSDLAAPFDMSLPAVSKHLKVLEKAGLTIDDIDPLSLQRLNKLIRQALAEGGTIVDHRDAFGLQGLHRVLAGQLADVKASGAATCRHARMEA